MIIQGVTLIGVTVVDSSIVTQNLEMNLDPANGISGSTWINSATATGSSLNYALQNSPTTTTVNGSTVLNFAGGTGETLPNYTKQYAFNSTGFGSTLNTSAGFTIDIWASPRLTSDAGCLIKEWGQGTGNVPDSGYESPVISFSGGNIQVGYYGTGFTFITGSAGSFVNGNWYNIVMVYNGSTGATVYVNNVSSLTLTGQRDPPTNDMFSVALCDDFGAQGTTRYFTGYVGPFKVYERALTTAERTVNFNAIKNRYGV
jgi:hypothetical protein